jgi:Flp pilus assembly protein TadB
VSGQLGALLTAAGFVLLWLGVERELLAKLTRRALGPAFRGKAKRAARLTASAVALALVCALGSWWLARLPVISLLAAAAGGYLPFGLRRARSERQGRERERAWPAALEQLADGLEAGLAFPAAAAFVAGSGPSVLRGQFAGFYQAARDGRLEQGLDELATAPERAAATAAALLRASFVETPTGRVAPILRELAGVLRERWETRERGRSRALSLHREAAILALSPLAFLLLIGASAPGYLDAYRSFGGTLVSVAGAAVIGGCYLAMRRLGRIPEPGGKRSA